MARRRAAFEAREGVVAGRQKTTGGVVGEEEEGGGVGEGREEEEEEEEHGWILVGEPSVCEEKSTDAIEKWERW